MSKLFRECIKVAYQGKLSEGIINKMLLADLDKDLAENEMYTAILEKKEEDRLEQIREQDLLNENLQKDKI